MRAVEMQPAVIQSLNVQNQQQQQITQMQVSQEAFAAALERTASLRPEQVQEAEATPGKDRAENMTEERGEARERRRRAGAGPAGGSGEAAAEESAPLAPGETGSRIDIVV